MPKIKRPRIAHTEEWAVIQQRTLWPEGAVTWHQVIREVPSASRRKKRALVGMKQHVLFPEASPLMQ